MPVVPMFPLEVAMLPGEELPLRVFEPRYTAMVSDCLATDDPAFGVEWPAPHGTRTISERDRGYPGYERG